MAGLVTNDSLALLRGLWEQGSPRPSAPRQPLSSLEAQLAERLGGRDRNVRLGGVRRPSQQELQAARRRVRERLGQSGRLRTGTAAVTGERAAAPPAAPVGRWALVHRFGVMGKPLSPAEQVAVQARQLLARHGVVTHASLDDEFGAWDWGLIYPELQRLELRGEVRRGYFVQGLAGVQFALPAVVEQLRELASAGPRADPATMPRRWSC